MQFAVANGSGRCHVCHTKIEKGEKQIKGKLNGGYYAGNFHLVCFKDKYWGFIVELIKTSLNESEKNYLKSYFDSIDGDYVVTRVSKEDILSRVQTVEEKTAVAKLIEADMVKLADFISEQTCEQDVFWNCIDTFIHDKGITK